MSPEPTSSKKIQNFGKYCLIAELAKGGMGVVYLAVVRGAAGFHKLTVVKELRSQFAEDPDGVQMFLDEAKLAARLNHPNVVQTFEVGAEEQRPYFAMEYLEGETFHRLVRRGQKDGKPVPLGLQIRVLSEMLAGLHYAHELQDYDGTPLRVVHRDVSPQNVFVTYDGQVKVVDFGIAKAADSSSNTRTGVLKGKIGYMAPEQARGEEIDRRVDVFAAGVMLWEAVTGKKMWENLNDQAILHRLIVGMSPAPPELSGVRGELLALAQKATAPSPAERFQTAEEFQTELEALLPQLGNPSSRELGRLVNEMFSEKRSEIRALVEKHLQAISSLQTGEFSSVDMLRLTAGQPSVRATPISQVSERARGDSAPTFSTQVASIAPTPPESLPSRPPSRLPLVLGGGFALGALLLGLALALRSAGKEQEAPVASPPAPQVSAPHAPAREEETTVELEVKVSPAGAQISIDQGPPEPLPLRRRVPRDDREHTLRVEAEGYTPRSERIRFSRDVILDWSLERAPSLPAGATAKASPVAPPRHGANSPAVAPPEKKEEPPKGEPAPASTKGNKPKRTVDRNDPYAN